MMANHLFPYQTQVARKILLLRRRRRRLQPGDVQLVNRCVRQVNAVPPVPAGTPDEQAIMDVLSHKKVTEPASPYSVADITLACHTHSCSSCHEYACD